MDPTAIAEPLVAPRSVLANQAIWEFRPNVDRNAFQTVNALHPCHASTSNVRILVVELVAQVLLAPLSTTIRFALVHLEQRATHLPPVVVLLPVRKQFKSALKKLGILLIYLKIIIINQQL